MLGKLGRAALVAAYRMRLGSVGKRFRIGLRSTIENPRDVHVGDWVFMGPETYIASPTRVEIHDRVMFGPQVMLIGGDHDVENRSVSLRFAPAPPSVGPIVIEHDAWICARALILKGVTIGAHAIVGAAAVVTRDVPSNAIVAGNPARTVRLRRPFYCPDCGLVDPQRSADPSLERR
jgi:maltose O-acetyltransferase